MLKNISFTISPDMQVFYAAKYGGEKTMMHELVANVQKMGSV